MPSGSSKRNGGRAVETMNATEQIFSTIAIGVGATVVMDIFGLARKRLRGTPTADYGLVGRWLGHMLHGRFRHAAIAKAAAVPGERTIGWIAHYLTGIAFAAILIAIWGVEWLHAPRPIPAMIVGVGSVVAPFFMMQPGMGLGVAASRTPNPRAARLRSLSTHAVFGAGLYVAGLGVSAVLG